jgi:hypothetical protein
MVIWQITGPEIGDNGAGVAYHAKKGEAARALREWRKKNSHGRSEGVGPTQVKISGRDATIEFVRRAMALAMGVPVPAEEEDVGDAAEFL